MNLSNTKIPGARKGELLTQLDGLMAQQKDNPWIIGDLINQIADETDLKVADIIRRYRERDVQKSAYEYRNVAKDWPTKQRILSATWWDHCRVSGAIQSLHKQAALAKITVKIDKAAALRALMVAKISTGRAKATDFIRSAFTPELHAKKVLSANVIEKVAEREVPTPPSQSGETTRAVLEERLLNMIPFDPDAAQTRKQLMKAAGVTDRIKQIQKEFDATLYKARSRGKIESTTVGNQLRYYRVPEKLYQEHVARENRRAQAIDAICELGVGIEQNRGGMTEWVCLYDDGRPCRPHERTAVPGLMDWIEGGEGSVNQFVHFVKSWLENPQEVAVAKLEAATSLPLVVSV